MTFLDPTPETEALYRSMPTPELKLFQRALILDQNVGDALPQFCQPRIDLITRVLAERGERPTP